MLIRLVVFCLLARLYSAFLCSGCSRPYSFGANTGVGACPDGFNLQLNDCIEDSNKRIIIDTKFSLETSFEASTIDNFVTSSGVFRTIGNPFPTIDRGFYFPKNGFLNSIKNYIPSPSTTIALWVRVLTYGYIIKINGDTTYLILEYKNNAFYFHNRFCNDQNICDYLTVINTYTINNEGVWIAITVMKIPNNINTIDTNFILYQTVGSTISINGENSISVQNSNEIYKWTIGDESTGFEGFVYSLKVINIFYTYFQLNIIPNLCNPYFYFDQGNCLPCSGNITQGLWCVRPSDNNPCYNNFCSLWTGYTINECTSWTGQCSSGCLECSDYYHCSICHIGYLKASYDWGIVCKEDLQFSLLSSNLSTFIKSVNNYKPKPGRGFYFEGSYYLTTNSKFIIPTAFLVYMWIFPIESRTILSKGNNLNIHTDICKIIVKHHDTALKTLDAHITSTLNVWQFIAIEVYRFNHSLEIQPFSNGAYTLVKDYFYNFVDNIDDELEIGRDFLGFIAMIGIASKVINEFKYNPQYMSVISSVYGNELNPCISVSENSFEDADTCSVECTICDICKDFSTSDCYYCPSGYYHSSITCSALSQNTGVIHIDGVNYRDLGSCLFSAKGLGCSACNLGYVLYKNICIPSCPTGYNLISEKCIPYDYKVFVKDFRNLLEIGQLDNIIFGNEGTKTYPEFDLNDPIPAYGKGYYFTSFSYMKVQNLIFGPEMSIGIWVFIKYSGYISTKGTGFNLKAFEPLTLKVNYENWLKELAFLTNFDYIDSWVFIATRIWYDIGLYLTTIEMSINNYVVSTEIIELNYYFNNNDTLYIGSDPQINNELGFEGFLSYFEIYSTSYIIQLFNKELRCEAVHLNDKCLDNCNRYDFYNKSTQTCDNCNTICSFGCLRSDDCILCENPSCQSCSQMDSDKCLTCKTNFDLDSDGVCNCNFPNIFNSLTLTCTLCTHNCFTCHSLCSSCDGPNQTDCIMCKSGLYKVEGFCIACPSLSIIINSTECEIILGKVFSASFTTLSGVIYDSVNKVPIITGNSKQFYPDYDSEDPIAAHKRGLYFNGKGSVLRLPEYKGWISPKLILSINWTIEIWFNSKSQSGCFLSYSNSDYALISLCYLNSNISVSILIDLYSTYTFDLNSTLNKWKVLMISFEYNGAIKLSVFMDETEKIIEIKEKYVVPNYLSNSFFEIGKSKDDYFTGFIYKLSVYSYKPDYYQLSHSHCEGVLIEYCLPDCGIQEFYLGPDPNDCGLCHDSCSQGCIRKDSCSLCNDPLCYECSDFDSKNCKKCSFFTEETGKCGCADGTVLDYEVHRCKGCDSRQFFNSSTCKDCSEFCISCNNENDCLKCSENASLDNGKCLCNPGYNGTIDCDIAEFEAQLIISDKNYVYIQFDDKLITELDASYILVSTSKISVKSIEIEQWTSTLYKIKLTYSSTIPQDTNLVIQFKKQIFSIYNSVLITDTLTASLHSDEISKDYQSLFSDSEKTSSTVTIASTAASVGISLANPNPACLWSFINAIQMLCFIQLSSIPLRPKFSGQLKGLLNYNPVPNIFSYFIPRTGGTKPFKRAYEFGYIDHLILFNISKIITTFLCMIGLLIITYIMSKLTIYRPFSLEFIKKTINNSLKGYKYGAFIRFWITFYIDIFASALIGVITTEEFSIIGIMNFTSCIIFILLIGITPILFFYLTYNKKNLISDQNNEIQQKWGSFFYEFNTEKGLSCIQFYFYFFIRRIFFIIILMFLQDTPIIQISLIISLSTFIFVYLVIFRPFKEQVLNVSNCLSELIITVIFVILVIDKLNVSKTFELYIDDVLVGLLNTIMGVQILASVYVFARTIFLNLKERCNGGRLVLPASNVLSFETNTQNKQTKLKFR